MTGLCSWPKQNAAGQKSNQSNTGLQVVFSELGVWGKQLDVLCMYTNISEAANHVSVATTDCPIRIHRHVLLIALPAYGIQHMLFVIQFNST